MSSIRVAILTVSDRSARNERPDLSGPALQQLAQELGWQTVHSAIVPDVLEDIQRVMIAWCDLQGDVDLVLTSGGTGFAPRDITPEATLAVIDRNAPGLAEAMRQESLKITPHAMLSRLAAGIRGQTLIVNLPGRPKAIKENLDAVFPAIPYCIELIGGPALEVTDASPGAYRPPQS